MKYALLLFLAGCASAPPVAAPPAASSAVWVTYLGAPPYEHGWQRATAQQPHIYRPAWGWYRRLEGVPRDQ